MFRTLRSKLIFSYAAVAALCLLLALVVMAALARGYSEQTIYRTLHDKSALAYPFVQLDLNNPERPLMKQLHTRIREGIVRSGTRVLFIDPTTMQIQEDVSMRYHAVGAHFSFDVPDSELGNLELPRGVEGRFRLPGEDVTFLYVARRVQALTPGGAVPNSASGSPNSSLDTASFLVVMAQPERDVPDLAQNLFGYIGWAALIALLLSLGVAYALARSISRPIARLTEGATAMSRGDYSRRITVSGHDELAALTERFNEMAREVGSAHQMERDFVANVSHDLKTPLTSIQGFSQAMLDGAITEPEGFKQAAGIINSEAERMSRLVSELLNLSRLQNGLKDLRTGPLELRALLVGLASALRPQALATGVQLDVTAAQKDVWVSADPDRLKQALGNVVDNALKYTPSGGSVHIELTTLGQAAQVTVRDTGPGIPPDDLPRVMERFYQVEKSRASADGRSAGLGLAIAREIVSAHGGQISVASSAGTGTTVCV